MKHLAITAATLSILASAAFAGSKAAKEPVPTQTAPSRMFGPDETQLDLYGAYMVGNGPLQAGPLNDHGWGGGIGMNQFWTENFGIGIDVTGFHGRENLYLGNEHKTIVQYTGSLILRVPYEEYNMAPYGFLGGGVTSGAGNWGSAHAGLGVEYRVVPNSVGIFTDARWTYYGDAHGNSDLNNFQLRAGVRFMF